MRSQSGYTACSIFKCIWHVGNFSFETLFSNADLNEDTQHLLGHQKCSALVSLEYHNVLAFCLGFFSPIYLFSRRFLGWQPMLSCAHDFCELQFCDSLLLFKVGPVPFLRRHFYFLLAPERVKLHILTLQCHLLKSIRYSSVWVFVVIVVLFCFVFNVPYNKRLVNFVIFLLKGKSLVEGSSGTLKKKQCIYRQLVKIS